MTNTPPSSSEKLSSKFDISISIIGISVILFLMGIGYHAGFLRKFGLSSDLFSKDSHLLVLDGFYCLSIILICIIFVGLPILLLFILRSTLVYEYPRYAVKYLQFMEKQFIFISNPVRGDKFQIRAWSLRRKLFVFIYGVVISPLIAILMLLGATNKISRKSGSKFNKRVATEELWAKRAMYPFLILVVPIICYSWGAFVGIQDGRILMSAGREIELTLTGGKSIVAKQIICNDSRCSFVLNDKKVIVLSNEQIKSISAQTVAESSDWFMQIMDVLAIDRQMGLFKFLNEPFAN